MMNDATMKINRNQGQENESRRGMKWERQRTGERCRNDLLVQRLPWTTKVGGSSTNGRHIPEKQGFLTMG